MNDYFNHDNPLTRHTLGRAEQVNGIFQAVEAGFDKLPKPSEIYEGRTTYVVDSGAANAYAVDLPHAPEAYTAGMSFTMKAANANTGASTVNVNELGVIPIRRFDGTDLMPGDIIAGMLVQIAYDGSVFRIIGTHGGEVSLARAWASRTSGPVADGLFSALEYAAGNQAGTGGSAKNWAQQAGGVTGAGAGDRSAKSWAQEELVTGTLGGSAKDWAQYTGGSISGQGWSAKAFAQSEGLLSTGSAKEWATKLTEVSGGLKGARGYAQDALASASAAASSASNALGSANAAAGSAQDALTHYNTFRGIYYGALADDPATDPNGDPTTAGDIYFNSVSSRARIYNGSAWQDLGLNSLGDGSAASPGLAFLNDPDTGIFRPGNNTFAIATGGAEHVRVTSTGNVGVGATNPDARLVVADASNPVQMRIGYTIDGISAPRARWTGRSGSANHYADIELDTVAGLFTLWAPSVGTAPSIRAINILSTGVVTVGKTATGHTEDGVELHRGGFIRVNRTNVTLDLNRRGSDGDIVWFHQDGTRVGSISVTASSTAYNTSSDYRLKENVVPLTGALDRLSQIPVYRFNFINAPGRTVDGFLAHEVQAVVAEAVTGEKDAVDEDGNIIPQQIDQSKLVPLLTAAVKELAARVEALEAA